MGKGPRLISICLIGFLSGCASYQVGGQFQSGRRALLVNDPQAALPYFLAVADSDPNFVYRSMYYSEGIWTYVGRTQYATGKLAEARQSLERALSLDKEDNLARLYLGLTLSRMGDNSRGSKEIEAGMRGLHDWLEYIERTRPSEGYWDPAREIRTAIEKDLDRISAKDLNREQLIADAEWLGLKMESEIDKARQDERRRYERDFDRRPGVGFGIGF